MILYRYLTPERIDVLENLAIRLTQPPFLNDPYESNPNIIGSEMTDVQWEKISKIEAERNGLDIQQFQHLSKKEERDSAFPGTLQLMKLFFHHTTGVLSLSESVDSPLMWAHYTSNHTGFALGLKTDNSFFYTSKKDFTINNLSKVIYTKSRPNVMLESLKMQHMYFTKSDHWHNEREWRLLKNTDEADIKMGDGRICLFKIDPNIIDSVYLGAACSQELEERLVASVTDRKLPIKIFRIILNEVNFDLDVISYEEWLELKKELSDDKATLLAMREIIDYLYLKKNGDQH